MRKRMPSIEREAKIRHEGYLDGYANGERIGRLRAQATIRDAIIGALGLDDVFEGKHEEEGGQVQ